MQLYCKSALHSSAIILTTPTDLFTFAQPSRLFGHVSCLTLFSSLSFYCYHINMSSATKTRKSRRAKKKDYKQMVSPAVSLVDNNEVSEERNETLVEEDEIVRLKREVEEAELCLRRKEEVDLLTKKKEKILGALGKREGKEESINASTLRSMESVVNEVDNLMNKKLNFSSTDSSSDSESDSSSDDDRKSRKKKKKNKSSRSKRSGKDRKITSRVRYPQDWPHSFLSLHYVDKDKKYDQLTMSEFCAGYLTIMENISDRKILSYRTTHLKDLMYLTTKYNWKAVLNFHAACLLEIERGQMEWGDSFHRLESTTLAGGHLRSNNVGGSAVSGFSGSRVGATTTSSVNNSSGPILFCKEYQRGVCSKTSDHEGIDRNGETRFFRHICAVCWLKAKKMAAHPETQDSCPSKDL